MMPLKTVVIIAASCGFLFGGGLTRCAWQAERAERDAQALAQADAAVQKLKEMQDEKDAALSERDRAIDRAHALAVDGDRLAERLRRDAAKRPASTVPASACEPCERHLSECRELLGEGAGLAAEGGWLVRRFDADRAAVRRLLK